MKQVVISVYKELVDVAYTSDDVNVELVFLDNLSANSFKTLNNVITEAQNKDKEYTESLVKRINELEEGMRQISVWKQEDQDNPEICAMQWRGCVAIGQLLLDKTSKCPLP